MTKLLAAITLLLSLLVSPLLAKEKILKCEPLQNRFLPPSYYKMKTSFLGFTSYYLRQNNKWIPFCRDKGSAVSWDDKEVQNTHIPIKVLKGDNSVACEFYEYEPIYERKVVIDFDINRSTFCYKKKPENSYAKKHLRTRPFDCYYWQENQECTVVE
jgi:hypothetical protein